MMNRMFEPVLFDRRKIPWDYRIYTEHNFKGYYHWHQCCEVLFVHEGKGNVIVNRQNFDIRRGMLFFFQPFQLHRVHAEVSAEQPYLRSIFYVDPVIMDNQLRMFPHRQALFSALARGNQHCLVFDLYEQAGSIEWIYESYERNRDRKEDSEESTILMLHLLDVLSHNKQLSDVSFASSDKTGGFRYSETVMRWIEDHFHEDISLEILAAKTHLTTAYLSRIFRVETGSRISDYITARRIKQACRLLHNSALSVEEIGIRVGYLNTSYFIQLFKKVVGVTPLKYRTQTDLE